LVLDLNLVIENQVYQEVLYHMEQASDVSDSATPKVSESLTQSYKFLVYVL
jgi:hypothetical protein